MARKRVVKNMTLQEQAEEILRRATEKGVSSNFFFVTTFKRYQMQIQILTELEKEIKRIGTTITKTYVKGRENVCVHPLVQEIPKHVDCANRTLGIIGKIIVERGKEKPDADDPLDEFRL